VKVYKSELTPNNINFYFSIPLQVWADPEGSRRLKFLSTGHLNPPKEIFLVLISVRG
jgi:hypothetical protein